METLQRQRSLVEQRRQADFEAYQAWEHERRLYEEITDIAERVRAPIAPMQEFTLSLDGLVSARGELLRPVMENGLAEARRMALTNPDWQVEVRRREIELDEYNDLESLAHSGFGAMVSYWPIPDAVRAGNSDLPGYNRDRLKMFTRISVATPSGVIIKYHSYDGGYMPGIQAMDRVLGNDDFDASRSSEEIAATRRYIVPPDNIDELDEQLRRAYDDAILRNENRVVYSGSEPLAVKDVFGFIASKKSLLDEHMAVLHKIFDATSDHYERIEKMKPHRYNFAAAIDDLLHGKEVVSIQDAGEGARSEGRNLEGDCPTGEGEETAVGQLGEVGFRSAREQKSTIWGPGECVACLRDTVVAINKCNMCQGCEDVHNTLGDAGLNVLMAEAKRRRAAENARKRKIADFAFKKR